MYSVTGQHTANQCKLIFSEYGWPETLISDNSPCYTSQAFTSVIQSYNGSHITGSLHYLQSDGLAEKYVQIVKSLFYKAKEEGKVFYKYLMICCNTPLTGFMKSPIQIFQGRNARSHLPMSNGTRKQCDVQPKVVRNNDKHAVLPTHDLHVGQDVMHQDYTSKLWYPAVIQRLCFEPRSYNILTRYGVVYRKTQSPLKLLYLRRRNLKLLCVCHPQLHNLLLCNPNFI